MFNEYPFGDNLVAEKLRSAVGLKLNDDIKLSLVFLQRSVSILGKIDESSLKRASIDKSLDMLVRLGVSIYVEESELPARMKSYITPHFFRKNELWKLMENANRVIC